MDSFIQKKIVITGGNSGIGLETAKGLYGDGHNVVFGSRDEKKNTQAIQQIKQAFPDSKGTIIAFKLDLSSKKSIDQFAVQVKKIFSYIDILINNAGLATDQAKLSELGFEFTMTVNHFGHFYLTYLLFDNIIKSKEARIINVSSELHQKATDDIFSHLELKQQKKLSMLDRYSDSKFANVLFTNGLNQRLAKYPHIKTASLHPGVVSTNFGKGLSLMQCFKCLCCCLFVKQQQGATCSLSLSRRSFTQIQSGEYYNDDAKHKQMDKRARNNETVQKLWSLSQKAYNIKFNP